MDLGKIPIYIIQLHGYLSVSTVEDPSRSQVLDFIAECKLE